MADLLKVALRGDLARMMRDERKAVERAATSSVRQATNGLKRGIQRQLESKLDANENIKNVVGSYVEPRRGSALDAEGRVFSRFRYSRVGGVADLLQVFDTGTIIVPQHGEFIAIPTKYAPRTRGVGTKRAMTPAETGLDLVFIPAKGENPRRPNVAVLTNKSKTRVLYVLTREARIKKRIDIDKVYQRESAKLERRFHRILEREDRKLESRYGGEA